MGLKTRDRDVAADSLGDVHMRMQMRLALVALAFALLPIAVLPAQEVKAVEPEYASVFYFLREGQLADLERQTPKQVTKGKNFLIVIDGEKSTVRLSANESMQFVVRVTENYDKAVSTLQLFRFESQNGKRQFLLKISDLLSNRDSLGMRVEKYGNSSLKAVPSAQLAPGEYCISRTTIPNGYCFGVDAAGK